jgi:ribosomal protein L32
MYEIQWLHSAGIKVPLPVILEMDNQAAIIDAGSPTRRFSQRTKHFLIDEKYVHQCSEMGIVKLRHRNTTELDADVMTKCVPGVILKKHAITLTKGNAGHRG